MKSGCQSSETASSRAIHRFCLSVKGIDHRRLMSRLSGARQIRSLDDPRWFQNACHHVTTVLFSAYSSSESVFKTCCTQKFFTLLRCVRHATWQETCLQTQLQLLHEYLLGDVSFWYLLPLHGHGVAARIPSVQRLELQSCRAVGGSTCTYGAPKNWGL